MWDREPPASELATVHHFETIPADRPETARSPSASIAMVRGTPNRPRHALGGREAFGLSFRLISL
jgi:hypothetical protein